MNANEFLSFVKKQNYYRNQLVYVQQIPAKRAKYGKLTTDILPKLAVALKKNGTTRLYKHQATAIEKIRQGEDVVVVTATASGKSLSYQIPVIEAILKDSLSRSLFLFPTKALAHDQLRSFHSLIEPLSPQPKSGAYDGDTSPEIRQKLKENANILFTNPDMLHLNLLPNHSEWMHFFRKLKYVVIDEAHTYRGVFGSHVAVILRRLNRIAEFYGNHIQFISTSATISNPIAHIEQLTGRKPSLVDNDGAPQQSRIFAIWNPPRLKSEPTKRRSAVGESTALFADMARARLRNITFTKSRAVTEIILKYAEKSLEKTNPKLVGRISAYRAGYLNEHRKAIELALLSGRILGVASTNALELGVNIGGLDAVMSVGYPGSIASLWQQMGRAGRQGTRKGASLALLVAMDNPLDQYFVRHPQVLFEGKHENALVNPDNVYILLPHLACAALELPLTPADEKIFGKGFISAMIKLENEGRVIYQPEADNWIYMGESNPALRINIRSMGQKNIDLIDVTRDEVKMETMGAGMASSKVYPGAIYLHRGESYRVKSLNLAKGEARLVAVSADYYTQSIESNQLTVIESTKTRKLRRTTVNWGRVEVKHRVLAYKKISHLTARQSKRYELSLPPRTYGTRAVWWDISPFIEIAVTRRGMDFVGGIYAIENALKSMVPLYAMCDKNDIGTYRLLAKGKGAQLFLFDTHPGGVGISEQTFLLIEEIWAETLKSIKKCTCENGCPSCIFDSRASMLNKKLDKKAAIFILGELLR